MNRGLLLFLKGVILLIASGVLISMIRFPQTEGRAANLDLFSIYTDPLIIYGYIASIPFFVGLYQAFILVGLGDKKKLSSQAAVHAARTITYCALALIGFIVGALVYIRIMGPGEDVAGPSMLGLVAISTFVVIAVAAGVFQKRIQVKKQRD